MKSKIYLDVENDEIADWDDDFNYGLVPWSLGQVQKGECFINQSYIQLLIVKRLREIAIEKKSYQ